MKWSWVAASAVALVSCRASKVSSLGCASDSDCGNPAAAYRCEAQTGTCYCRTDVACTPKEFFNTSGFCQDQAGYQTNADCVDPSLSCDTTSATCLSNGRCATDLNCPIGKVCSLPTATCVVGCHTNGDCSATSCRCGDGG